jgi:hypothetical protein
MDTTRTYLEDEYELANNLYISSIEGVLPLVEHGFSIGNSNFHYKLNFETFLKNSTLNYNHF